MLNNFIFGKDLNIDNLYILPFSYCQIFFNHNMVNVSCEGQLIFLLNTRPEVEMTLCSANVQNQVKLRGINGPVF